ncbi:hypothetical protein Ga0466249_005293 [Sporomusaceae bacterium BoRhaA]|uniref:host-nuclease inhibitor Gam family protein n=1 Tax=Pelorhabdus rhamnosifermentans TaxID=2772457 RepID=UPI001C05F310|nr:host-nuclease inhibitor Gam family protein [Pelorhabdus rhamnosifermentans]MBU2704139.1 hypothetical protein [Pelorhabdus rhamnosifermentans]
MMSDDKELTESLDEFLDSQVMDAKEPQKNQFVIDNDEKADWAIRHIVECQRKNERVKQFAQKRIELINKWRGIVEDQNNRSIEFLIRLLRPYAEQQLVGKTKTVSLPSGNASFHKVNPEFFISGEKISGKNKTLTERVEQLAPELIITEKSTDWTEFKNTLTVMEDGRVISATGEILDFIEAIEYPDSLTVKERK